MFDREVNWMFETEPEPRMRNRNIKIPRGRVLGGSSSINGLIYIRGQREDFDDWRDLGNPGWGYDGLPAVLSQGGRSVARRGRMARRRAVRCRYRTSRTGIRSRTRFIAAGESVGIARNDDFNGARQEGLGYFQGTARNGLRCSAAVAYLRPAMKRPNLVVATHALATRVLTEGARATGVEYRQDGATRRAFATREVLVAAGAIQSPQLMQLSGIGPGELLQRHGIPVVKAMPGVGRNLHDHLQARFIWKCAEPITVNDDLMSPWRKLELGAASCSTQRAAVVVRGARRRLRAHAARADAPGRAVPLLSLQHRPHRPEPAPLLGIHDVGVQAAARIARHAGDQVARPGRRAGDPAQFPRARGRCRDHARRHEAGAPLAATPALVALDQDRARSRARRARRDDDLVDFLRNKGFTVYHPVGTCKMGSDPEAVVDHELRVHGMQNLRVDRRVRHARR